MSGRGERPYLPAFRFGDVIENTMAGESNPVRFAYFVRWSRGRGSLAELTDGKGRTWLNGWCLDGKVTLRLAERPYIVSLEKFRRNRQLEEKP